MLYDEFVLYQEDVGHRSEFYGRTGDGARFLGNDTFVDQILRQINEEPVVRPKLENVHQAVKELFGVSDEELREAGQNRRLSELRALFAWGVLELSDGPLSELSLIVNRDASSLSSSVKRLKQRSGKEPGVLKKMEELQERVHKLTFLQA